MKVIKDGSENLRLLKINDNLFTCDTPIGTIFDEFNRLSGMDDDLFTYEVGISEVSSIPCDEKQRDDSDDSDLDVYEPRVCYDENDEIYAEVVIFVNKRLVRLMDVIVEQWIDLMYSDHKKVDMKIKKQWVARGIDADMEYDPSDIVFVEWLASEFYNHMMMDRIKTDIFDFKTPLCKAFNEFNYLLKIDTNLLTSDIHGFKTYDEFKNEWMDEWNKGIPWVPEEPWSENGIPIDDIHHICEPFHFKSGKAKWSTYYKWYDDLIDGKLKEEALKQKAMYERSWGDSTQGRNHICEPYANTNIDANYNPYLDVSRIFNNHAGRSDKEAIHDEREPTNDHNIRGFDNHLVRDNAPYHTNEEKEQYKEERCKLLRNLRQGQPVCKIERFKVIKYSFGPAEKFVAIKECAYEDCTRTE
ncbi:hypothetical protein Tco_1186404 [Tanacetum coccineum]